MKEIFKEKGISFVKFCFWPAWWLKTNTELNSDEAVGIILSVYTLLLGIIIGLMI